MDACIVGPFSPLDPVPLFIFKLKNCFVLIFRKAVTERHSDAVSNGGVVADSTDSVVVGRGEAAHGHAPSVEQRQAKKSFKLKIKIHVG